MWAEVRTDRFPRRSGRLLASLVRRGVVALLLALAAPACKDGPKPTPADASSATRATEHDRPPLAARDVDGEVAFDLVATQDGAVLMWGSPGKADARLEAALLDAHGGALGEPISLRLPGDARSERIVEVSAAASGTRIGVAWVATEDQSAMAWGAVGDAATRAFTPAVGLGEVTLTGAAQRGHLAVAASERSQLLVLRRGIDEPCFEDPKRRCAAFAFRELIGNGTETRGLPLSVPAPCAHAIAGFTVVDDRWHYALCSQAEGAAKSTLFSVQRTPFYADAKPIHAGCAPLGSTRVGEDAVTVAECPGGRRATLGGGLERPLRNIDLSQATLACERGRPVLRAPGDQPFVLELGSAREGVAPLLPSSIAPGNARAAWTGAALLVATWVQKKVVLHRWECRGPELLRAD